MNMKKLIISSLFFMHGFLLMAQEKNTLSTFEISLSTFQTNALAFDRNYDFDFQNGVNSSNTFGYSLSGRRTQSIFMENLSWFVGTRVGVHAYSIDLLLSQEFRDLGSELDYTTFSKSNYDLLLIDIFAGLRYNFPIGEKMKIGIEGAAVVNYHFQNDINHNEISLSNGQTTTLLTADMIVNSDNQVIIAPQFGLSYQYSFGNSGLRIAAYTLMASNNILEGSYQIFGDNETLEGKLSKDYSFGGLEIGYFWNL